HETYSLGPTLLEKKIEEETGVHIPHNTIYRILLHYDRVEPCMKKRTQRKWVRYERNHSMSLWQGDWKMILLDGQDRWLIAFMDDSSRLITCYGVFDRPTTEHTIQVLEKGFQEYGVPREILTDNGSQFVSSRNPETADHTFRKFLEYHGIRHIRARVNHPQTNGKIERFFGEVERRTPRFGSVERVVHWH
ncbi:MAG: DDE-type integrase/transposase/recombinase, partial [Methanolinea tarda]